MMRKRFPALVLFAAVLTVNAVACAEVTAAPVPRGLVSIDRPVVKLKDLFRNAGRQADAVLGPAPMPGTRILIATRQLAAIAVQFGVRWAPGNAAASVVIERPGTPIGRARLVAALRRALRLAGAPNHVAIQIGDNNLPMIPPAAQPAILVNRIAYHRMSGNFRARLLVDAPGMSAASARIAGLAEPAVQAVVAAHGLLPGAVLGSGDVRLAWIPRSDVPPGAITDPAHAVGMQIDRAIAAGTPLSGRMVGTPELIARGATVGLAVEMPGLEVTARGVALAAGGGGAVIPVLNPSSHEIVQAVIDGPDHAHVVPGSTPARARNAIPYYGLTGDRP
ncbi:flagellar basal body P-ring formation chaperone FlgA [Acidiphilium iwatense]|uniref:Flagellar basal body P-ring formation chaperone FlgA n=2 Tax=Acidiphilium iwatense TaxID=768198 RepID=A0ABS9DSI9_9PROT|nr:flagellar basal body P-ring formation chaperone FlgA [Acidiphilium iwatense]